MARRPRPSIRTCRCTVMDDRRSYAGQNAAGAEVRGRRAMVGWWEHRVANGAATMVRLFPNGKLNDAAGPASWELQGDTLCCSGRTRPRRADLAGHAAGFA